MEIDVARRVVEEEGLSKKDVAISEGSLKEKRSVIQDIRNAILARKKRRREQEKEQEKELLEQEIMRGRSGGSTGAGKGRKRSTRRTREDLLGNNIRESREYREGRRRTRHGEGRKGGSRGRQGRGGRGKRKLAFSGKDNIISRPGEGVQATVAKFEKKKLLLGGRRRWREFTKSLYSRNRVRRRFGEFTNVISNGNKKRL